jgi:hypothetical protein
MLRKQSASRLPLSILPLIDELNFVGSPTNVALKFSILRSSYLGILSPSIISNASVSRIYESLIATSRY